MASVSCSGVWVDGPNDLLLLTNQYPFFTGDSVFVASEIQSLAAGFDRVFVWTASTLPHLQQMVLPPNVTWAGSLTPSTPWRTLVAALRPSLMFGALKLIVGEVRQRQGRVRWPRLIRSAANATVGGSTLRRFVDDAKRNGSNLTAYAFWGTDCALALIAIPDLFRSCAIRLHGYDLYEDRVGYLPFRGALFSRANVLLTVSEHGSDYLKREYKDVLSLPRIVVARLGTWDHGPGPTPGKAVRIVSCSSLITLKRVDLILKVVTALSQERSVEWIHFGDGPERSRIEQMPGPGQGNLRIRMMGNVPNERVLEFYRSEPVSAFVNLSTTEGLPMSIMEALSFDIPVLATDVGGVGEIVGEEHGSGALVAVDASIEVVVEALSALLENRGTLRPRRVWEALCDASKNGDRVVRILQGAADLPDARTPEPQSALSVDQLGINAHREDPGDQEPFA